MINSVKQLSICFFVFLFPLSIIAQDGQYIRKSISTSGVLWNNQPDIPHIKEVDASIHAHITVKHLYIDRFDYNILPQNTLTRFYNNLRRVPNLTIDKFGEIINKTLKKDILSILNNPEVQRFRGNNLLSESDLQRFAAAKAKSLGLTSQELEVLLNTAYIYVPFISKVKYQKSDDMHSYTLWGGLIWYKIVVKPNGSSEVKLVKKIVAKGYGAEDRSGKNYFVIDNKYWETNNYQTAFHEALDSFYNNISTKTKELIDFKLTAQVEEVGFRKAYIDLGKKEGLYMGDMYFLMKAVESNDEVKYKRVAVMRVKKTGNNFGSGKESTVLQKIYGKSIRPGLIAVEHPRIGEEIDVSFRYISNYNYKPDGFNFPMTDAVGLRVSWANNLAPVKGLSQYYEDIELYVNFMGSRYYNDNNSAYDWGLFYNRKKKFGFWRTYLAMGLGLGFNVHGFKVDNTSGEKFNANFGLAGQGFSEFGFHMTPDWILKADISYKLTSVPGIQGVGFAVGLRKNLRQVSVPLFDFRNSQKKY